MKIANNVEMLELDGVGGAIYPTLTWDDKNLVLIDTGFPGQTEALTQAIADAGFSSERITHIILTHQDIDHIGCVLDIMKLSPAALVLAHEDEAPYIDGRKTPIKLAAMLEQYDSLPDDRKAWCDKLKVGFAGRIIPVSETVSDGDIIDICGGIGIIHTPGHTPGHICLFLQESRILVSGDALNINDGKITEPNPQHTYDMELGLQSAEKAKAWPFCAMVSYHGGIILKEELYMKTLVLFYSYTGHTKKIAESLAEKESADIVEIKEIKHPGRIKAYSMGCFAAIRGKSWLIRPLGVDLAAYDRLILLSPVWAGNPPPFVNTVLKQLPKGKTVSVKMIAASGKSGCEAKIEAVLKAKSCKLDGFEDIKA